jgi:hypothetical protein
LLLVPSALAGLGWAQSAIDPSPPPGAVPVTVQAVAGTPYGVATALIPLGVLGAEFPPRITIQDASGRIHYPSSRLEAMEARVRRIQPDNGRRIGGGALLNRLRTALQSVGDALEKPQGLRIDFLFTGAQPFAVQVDGEVQARFDVAPQTAGDAAHAQMMQGWWHAFTTEAKRQLEASDYPPMVQTYLTSMLAHRLNLPLPDLRSDEEKKQLREEPLSTLALLAGVESLRAEMLRQSMTLPESSSTPSGLMPLPSEPIWNEPVVPPVPSDLGIESIASAVPPECFYLRFGSFSNYLWFRQISEQQGGDLAKMVVLRGFNYETNRRIERMLNTRLTSIAKLFGDAVISDMAIIGQDLYLQEGPTLGVVFQAKNMPLLRTSMQQERAAAVRSLAESKVTLETIPLGSKTASLLSAPDNSVRSFLVEQGSFVLLTTSRHLAERFLAVTDGQPSLASLPSFRYARLLLPESYQYTLFAYFSPQFFRSLVSPQYQIELRRRLKAIGSIELAEMARLAWRGEGGPRKPSHGDSIDGMLAGGYLPTWFNSRHDGSRTLLDGDRWVDSLRGARGSFLPIADVTIHGVSEEEARQYRQLANFYQQNWQQTDPLVVGIRRFASPESPGCERVTLEAYVAPFGRAKYGWLSQFLAPPIQSQIQLPTDDIANVQVHLAGNPDPRRFTPNHVLFVGVKDLVPPLPGETKGLIKTFRTLKQMPAYLGAWPLPGYLDRLPLGMGGGPPDALGFSRLIIGLWRWQGGGFSVLSFDRTILEGCIASLRPGPASDPAQARLNVGSLLGSKLATWVNTLWYRRGLVASRGNVLLLDLLQQQFHVPASEALETAQRLLDAKLQCPLGGTYELQSNGAATASQQARWWTSTCWPAGRLISTQQVGPPADYQAPWLGWFRGGQVHLTQLPEQVILLGQFDLQSMPLPADLKAGDAPKPAELPSMNFDLFGLPGKLFQWDKTPKDPDNKEAAKANDQRRAF